MQPPTPSRDRARRLRRDETDAERKLWLRLRARQLAGVKFRRQVAIGPFFADFYSAERKLVIELDGRQHVERAPRDRARTRYLSDQGYRVIRFWDREVRVQDAARRRVR